MAGTRVDPGDAGDLSMLDAPMLPRRTIQGPMLDLSQPQTMDLSTLSGQDEFGLDIPDLTAAPEVRQRHANLQQALRMGRNPNVTVTQHDANAVIPDRSRAPTMRMPAKTVKGDRSVVGDARRGPITPGRTQQALNFAKALGFVGEEEASEEYAQAAAKALAKMTKGMSVAKLLSSAQRPKAQAEFQRLLEIEAAKMRQKQPAQPVRGLLSPAT